MENILKRRETLLKEAEKIYREQFKISIRCLEEKYNAEEYKKAVPESFAQAARIWNESQDRQAASLGICSLYSSILRQTYEYKIVLLGEEFWLDEDAVEIMWIPKGFPEIFEQDMSVLIKKLSGIFPRLCKEEETAIRFVCAEYFHGTVYKLCRDFIGDILENNAFLQLKKKEDFFVFFGGYRGEGEIWNILH